MKNPLDAVVIAALDAASRHLPEGWRIIRNDDAQHREKVPLPDWCKEVDPRPLVKRLHKAAQKKYAREQAEKPKFARNYYASGYTGCLRKTGYELLKIEPPERKYNPENEMEAEQGNKLHDMLQEWMRLDEEGLVYTMPAGQHATEINLSLSPEDYVRYRLSGRIDAIIVAKNGTPVLMDIKTVGGDKFDPHLGTPEAGRFLENLEKYRAQLQLYMHFWRQPDGSQVTKACVLLKSRSKGDLYRQFNFDYDREWMEAELTRVEAAAAATARGELPRPEPKRGPCNFCNYKKLCPAGNGTGEIVDAPVALTTSDSSTKTTQVA